MGPQNGYVPLPFVQVRVPLLPIEYYRTLNGSPAALLSHNSLARLAIAVGSSSLHAAITRQSLDSRAALRRDRKLTRYLKRMSTRPTPYGLFAGVGIGRWGASTRLRLDGVARRRVRPDMGWLLDFVFSLERDADIRRCLRFRTHPAARLAAGRFSLEDPPPLAKDAREGTVVSVRAGAAVRRILECAAVSASFDEVVAAGAGTAADAAGKAQTVVGHLCDLGFLLTDLRPPLTCTEPARYVASRLEQVRGAGAFGTELHALLDLAEAWERAPVDAAVEGYAALEQKARALFACPDTSPTWQVDTAVRLEGDEIAYAVAEEAARAAELLLRVTPRPRGLPRVDAIRRAFIERYTEHREIPLLEVVDKNIGLLATLDANDIHHVRHQADAAEARWRTRSETLTRLACEALHTRSMEVDLTPEVVAQLEMAPPSGGALPGSLDLVFQVAASSREAVDAGQFRIVIGPNVGVPGAGRYLGRFTDVLGDAGAAALRSCAAAEGEDAGVIRAELVYLPRRSRLANVSVRPALRSYEIALDTTPGVDSSRVIPLTELTVAIRAGRLTLRWAARDAEVRVTSTHMLNTLQANAAGRFLSLLILDGVALLQGFDWGPAEAFPFLPRVRAGRLILRVAQWRIDTTLRERAGLSGEFSEALSRWRLEWSVPRHVYLAVGDNRLLLDLEHRDDVAELAAELARLQPGNYLILQEMLPSFDDLWVQDAAGTFVAEYVASFVHRRVAAAAETARPQVAMSRGLAGGASKARMLHLPGSQWLFMKLYGARDLQNDLIAGPLRIRAHSIVARGAADTWFFVRYADPDHHVRLRFHGEPERLRKDLLPDLCDWGSGLVSDGLCTRFAFDAYEPETERYGGSAGIGISEELFCADSSTVMNFLEWILRDKPSLPLEVIAAITLDGFLSSIGIEAARALIYREMVPRHEGGIEYRAHKAVLRSAMTAPDDVPRALRPLFEIAASHRDRIGELGERLRMFDQAGTLARPLDVMSRSFAHMHCNRLLGVDRPMERRVIGLLRRVHAGLLGGRSTQRPPA